MQENILLELHDIVKIFPGVRALDGVHLQVSRGEVHALCGENGAGKSTLMKIISGAHTYDEGHMYFEGKEVAFHSTKEAETCGIAMIYQELNLIPDLSVAENLFLGRLPATASGRIRWKKLYDDAKKILARIQLKISPKTPVRRLSVAEAQMVEIAKCLTIGAKLIIMDEPTAALSEEETHILFDVISDLRTAGISILYISHRMDEIFTVADRLTVFRNGRHVATKKVSDTSYKEVVSLMVGRDIDQLYPIRRPSSSEIVYEADGIEGYQVSSVSFTLHRGEILGITGLLGSGTISLGKLLFGALPRSAGEIRLNGQSITCSTPWRSLSNWIGFISDDRKQEGLVLIRPVKENITMASLKKISRWGRILRKQEQSVVTRAIQRLHIRISGVDQLVGQLSGGNQQKIVFAKMLETSPSVLLLAEPTRGVDIGAKAEIYRILSDLAEAGTSILLITTDLPELIGLSDRVLIMREGQIVQELDKSQMTQETILAYASGGVRE